MKRAIFPGSFDPFTRGHLSILMRALPLFDQIVVAVGHNTDKTPLNPIGKRLEILEQLFKNESKISITQYSGLTMAFCKEQQAQFIIRGLRNAQDFNYEQPIAQTNLEIGGIETIFIASEPHLSHMSSTIARDIAKHGGDLRAFIPEIPQ